MPRSYRWAVLIAVIFGFQVAFSAAFDFEQALDIEGPGREESSFINPNWGPLVQHQVWLAVRSGYQTAVSGMLPWRYLSSGALALAAAAVFVLAMRLRMLTEERERGAELVGWAALVAAVLRTVDAAQSLVIARTVSGEAGKALIKGGIANAELEAQALSLMASAGSVVSSLLVVAVFMGLASYFRSDSLRAALGRATD